MGSNLTVFPHELVTAVDRSGQVLYLIPYTRLDAIRAGFFHGKIHSFDDRIVNIVGEFPFIQHCLRIVLFRFEVIIGVGTISKADVNATPAARHTGDLAACSPDLILRFGCAYPISFYPLNSQSIPPGKTCLDTWC